MYTKRSGHKRVPPIILNSNLNIQKKFIEGYYAGDGLKAGNGESMCSNSPFLIQGLCMLYYAQGKNSTVYVELRSGRRYYKLNIIQNNNMGRHLLKNPTEIRVINEDDNPDEWVFDLETESGVFCAGVGKVIVHNSPRRGETFVTRKITRAATRIKLGLQNKIVLGNLESKRDWSHAKDVANAIYLMGTADVADDWVVASGEMHSIKEFLELVFSKLDLDWQKYVEFDKKYLRPTEVDALCGDSTKIRTKLGWSPEYNFEMLTDAMIENDLNLAKQEKILLEHK
jgi:GDPmannose 4,6-dehydratase